MDGSSTPPAPVSLQRILMRRVGLVAVLTLLMAIALGAQQATEDMDTEQTSAVDTAVALLDLQTLQHLPDDQARERLATLAENARLRHLLWTVRDDQGRIVSGVARSAAVAGPPWLDVATAMHRHIFPAVEPPRAIERPLPRADGTSWTLVLTASPEAERAEALSTLLDGVALVLACVIVMLVVMWFNIRHALRPVNRLLTGIERLERQDPLTLQQLPPLAVDELESVAAALRRLAAALEQTELRRRGLAQQLVNVQEQERQSMARDLHDEMGQHLTALRLDLAWVEKRLDGLDRSAQAPAHPTEDHRLRSTVRRMAEQCRELQRDVRSLLTRLRPFTPYRFDGEAAEGISLDTVCASLDELAASWRVDAPGRPAPQIDLDVVYERGGETRPLSEVVLSEELALTLYRISQEALTNVARHAQAHHVDLRLSVEDGQTDTDSRAPCLMVRWSCTDDGVGLPAGALDGSPDRPAWHPAMPRGNGLAGMQERVLSQGGLWKTLSPARSAGGTHLEASFRVVLT